MPTGYMWWSSGFPLMIRGIFHVFTKWWVAPWNLALQPVVSQTHLKLSGRLSLLIEAGRQGEHSQCSNLNNQWCTIKSNVTNGCTSFNPQCWLVADLCREQELWDSFRVRKGYAPSNLRDSFRNAIVWYTWFLVYPAVLAQSIVFETNRSVFQGLPSATFVTNASACDTLYKIHWRTDYIPGMGKSN